MENVDSRLLNAAEEGDIKKLHTLIREKPRILDLIDDIPFVDTPLHIAASSGGNKSTDSSHRRAKFAVEVAILKPSLARKLNPEGFTPMHLALLNRQWKVVSALMGLDPELIRVKGEGGRTPLHVAAGIAPPQLLAELLDSCPSAIEDVTAERQTALHIAVEGENAESFAVLVGWLRRIGKENILRWKDMDGNTVLHVITETNQIVSVAKRGDIDMLYGLLRDNPLILDSKKDVPFEDTPLHVAASSGDSERTDDSSCRKAKFAVEVAILNPSLARKLNSEGLTPMHLALRNKEWKMVRALMRHDPELIRVKGEGGRTPLHVAAEIAPPQLLAELLYVCPSSIEDVTAEWQTAVHVAVEAKNSDSFAVLLGWLLRVDRENILRWKDMYGNTVLHVAARTNQIEVVKRLLKHVQDDVENSKGETAFAIHEKDAGLHRGEEMGEAFHAAMKRKGSLLSPFIKVAPVTPACRIRLGDYLSREFSMLQLWWRISQARFRVLGVGSQKSREAVIVVAILVATATYQGILSPPGGFRQEDSSGTNITTTNITSASNSTAHSAGQTVMNGKSLSNYMTRNSLAFVISVCLIIACIPGDVMFGLYLVITMIIFIFTYQDALDAILPPQYTDVRARVRANIFSTIIVAIGVLLFRLFLTFRSVARLKLETDEKGRWWELVGSDDDDAANRKSNIQHAEENHTANAEGRSLHDLEDP